MFEFSDYRFHLYSPGFFRFLMLCRCVDVPKCARYVVCEKLKTEHVLVTACLYSQLAWEQTIP